MKGIEDNGDGRCLIGFTTTANNGEKARQGYIDVYKDGFKVPAEVTLCQTSELPYISYTTNEKTVQAPDFSISGDGFILWGDGTYEYFDSHDGSEKAIVHQYKDDGPHTVYVESAALQYLLVRELENDMHFDFSKMKWGTQI